MEICKAKHVEAKYSAKATNTDRLIPLKEAGAISEIQVLQQANQLETQQDELIQLQNRREELINDSKSRQVELQGKQEQVRERLRNEIVRAPISGTVFDLKPDNDRYVAMNAESLLKIVPKGALSGEVNIENSDIGFIRKGQKVKVRIIRFLTLNTEKSRGLFAASEQMLCHQTN